MKRKQKGRPPALTPDQQASARWFYENTNMSIAAVAEHYGVSPNTINKALAATKHLSKHNKPEDGSGP